MTDKGPDPQFAPSDASRITGPDVLIEETDGFVRTDGVLSRIESMDPSSSEYINLSKAFANCLRHRAVDMGIQMGDDGYVLVSELLDHASFRNVSIALLKRIVALCPKQRFQLVTRPSKNGSNQDELHVRATQGQSIAFIRDDLLLTRIKDPSELPICLHGTYQNRMPAILESGLNKMNLNHIHMSTSLPEEESNDVILSGMHPNTEVVIEIDVEAAMSEGIVFYRSLNGVILSRGIGESGNIPTRFFKSIRDRNVDGLNKGR
jgi:2'-phosphotransferase